MLRTTSDGAFAGFQTTDFKDLVAPDLTSGQNRHFRAGMIFV
jgi:hypothetical protein